MKYETDEFGNIVNVFSIRDKIGDLKGKFWPDLRIGFFDTETSGLNFDDPESFRICQIAIAHYERPKGKSSSVHEPEEFRNWFIKPGLKMDPVSIKIHGVYDSEVDDMEHWEQNGSHDVKDAPRFEEVAEEIWSYLNSFDMLCAYNGLSFDVNAINSEFRRVGLDDLLKPVIDPFIWFLHRKGHLGLRRKGSTLKDAGRAFGATTLSQMRNEDKALHDARTDIQLLNDVLWKMEPQLPLEVEELLTRQSYFAYEHRWELK